MYKGGCIIPGIHTAFDSLSKLTAQLPKVGFSHSSKLPAKNTIQALEAGAFYGYRGMIREILEEIEKNLSWSQRPLRIATGGIVDKLAFNEDLFDVLDRELTLRGLWHLHLLNEN
ncbi:MAG: type III pantothenate kinase [Candidatus Hydrogenedentota bacterium]|nr:MAG: type III pantothenate kinase [Candidatus Hydrogenedentota bacterium]